MKILALDIGNAQIKAVIIDARFRRFDIVHHQILPLGDALDEHANLKETLLTDNQILTLRTFYGPHRGSIHKIICNIPLNHYSTRILTFPFKDKRKIKSAIEFAVEDEIPFDTNSCLMPFQMFPSTKKESHVLAAIAETKFIERYLERLKQAHIEPDIISIEQSSLASFLLRLKSNFIEDGVAVIDFGHKKTTSYMFKNGLPILQRTSMLGGYHITHTLAKRFEMSLAEAEVLKTQNGMTTQSNVSKHEKEIAEAVITSFQPIIQDIQQNLLAYHSKTKERISQMYICGGASLMPGLIEFLHEQIGLPPIPFRPLSHFPTISIYPQKNTEQILVPTLALGLSQVGSDAAQSINFCTGVLKSNQPKMQLQFDKFFKPLRIGAIFYTIMLFSLIGEQYFLNNSIQKLEQKQLGAIQNIVGNIPASQLRILSMDDKKVKRRAEEELSNRRKELAGKENTAPREILTKLKIMSDSITKRTTTEIKKIDIAASAISMTLESPDEKNLKDAIDQLSKSNFAAEISASKIEDYNGRKRISLNLKTKPLAGGA